MPASLCIQVNNTNHAVAREIDFYRTEGWNEDSEKELLARIQELMSVVRDISTGCEIKICMEVKDVAAALFRINKKTTAHFEIHNAKLSIREIEVLGLIMQGFTNNEIAEKLFISYETVKSHRKNILEKTGAKNTAALINYYHQTFFEK